MSRAAALLKNPIVILLAVALVTGLFLFRDFGLTWDEPLFYKYGDALGYAYNPANWFSGHFDLNYSYGPSGDDHKNRGPAWLLLAREPVYLLEDLGVDSASGWHLLNFLCFLLGVYFIYRLAERLTARPAAVAAAALFAFQPMLWGHAFINPKDMPFLVFLTGSVWLGFRMVDQLLDQPGDLRRNFGRILLPGLFLGLATANRVLGPLAGVLVAIYLLSRRPDWRTVLWLIPYAVLAALGMVVTWPYLWEGPSSLLNAVQFMSDNPTVLAVLFADHIYRAYDLPRRYLPSFLLLTLTECVWPLFLVAIAVAVRRLCTDRRRLAQVLLLLGWFAVPVLYVVVRRPPMYDGMRHFLFILPPVFILISFAFDFLFARLKKPLLNAGLVAVLLAPGILGIVALHPYEYTYYNSFIGGTAGAFRHYETDYWLTCYKQAVEAFNRLESQPVKLYVHREPDVAQPYAASNVSILDERGAQSRVGAGDFVLVNSRTNEDRQTFHDAPILLSIGRGGATFCVIKSIP
ncbi:MAG TPA: glycosyltransferase family 39 protein [Anaerolineales bacterium]